MSELEPLSEILGRSGNPQIRQAVRDAHQMAELQIGLSRRGRRRLLQLRQRLHQMTETEILETAVTHLLATLEHDYGVWVTVPSEPQGSFEEDGA